MKVTAVFTCCSKVEEGNGVRVRFIPPYCVDTEPGIGVPAGLAGEEWSRYYASRWSRVNQDWSQATPAGSVDLLITNRSAADAFLENETYLLTFEKFVAPKE